MNSPPLPKKLGRSAGELRAPAPRASAPPSLGQADSARERGDDGWLGSPPARPAGGQAEIAAPPSLVQRARQRLPEPAPARRPGWRRVVLGLCVSGCLALLADAAQERRLIAPFHLRKPVSFVAGLGGPFKSVRASLTRQLSGRTGLGADFPKAWPALSGLLALGLVMAATHPRRARAVAMRLGNLRWDANDFCRGWLITGATGSGKTAAAIVYMIHAICRTMGRAKGQAPWGGVCLDEKGLFYQTFVPILEAYGRRDDVLLLQVRKDDPAGSYEDLDDPGVRAGQEVRPLADLCPRGRPAVRLNLLYNGDILAATYAQVICDTARTAQGSGRGGEFNPVFPVTAQIAIRIAIDLCRAIAAREGEVRPALAPSDRFTPNLRRIYQLLSSRALFDEMMAGRGVVVKSEGAPSAARRGEEPRPAFRRGELLRGQPTEAMERLERFLKEINGTYFDLPRETFGGVKMSALSYLAYFNQDDIAEVFCSDCTFSFDELDQGKILFLAMPQRFKVERRYVAAMIKLLAYQHVLSRFDLPAEDLRRRNVLVVWQDEAQRTINADDGNVDVFREAKCAVVVATQMQSSLWQPLGGRENATVIIENLRSRFIFNAAAEGCAEASAQFLGRRRKKKISRSRGRGGRSTSATEEVAYKVEPYQLRNELGKYEAYVVHPDGRFRRLVVPCLDRHGDAHGWWLRDIALRHPLAWAWHLATRTWRRLGRRPGPPEGA